MSNILLNVEFLAGTDVREAITEAKQFAIKMDIAYVCFSFNGVNCNIGQKADIDWTIEAVMNAMSKDKMKFVISN